MSGLNRNYSEIVHSWIERSTFGLTDDQVVILMEDAFRKVLDRAHCTISELNLIAILERAQFNATDNFRLLSTVQINPSGISFDALRKQVPQTKREEMIEGFQCFMTEFLCITGRLTSEVIAPDLLDELSRASWESVATTIKDQGYNHDKA